MQSELDEGSDTGVTEGDDVWHLRLYVAGTSPKSMLALANLKNLCEEYLAGHYMIEIVDLVEHPLLARDDDILAVPTLVLLPPYELTLFVSGSSDVSASAVTNARQLCDIHLAGRYHLHVVDVDDDPAAYLSNRVLAGPILVRKRPLPARKLVGDLSDTQKVLVALQVPVANDAGPSRFLPTS